MWRTWLESGSVVRVGLWRDMWLMDLVKGSSESVVLDSVSRSRFKTTSVERSLELEDPVFWSRTLDRVYRYCM